MHLALDLSRHLGWAVGIPGGSPRYGLIELPSVADAGKQAAALADSLSDLITVHAPTRVIMEVDLHLHQRNPADVAYQQLGMAYVTELVCYRRELLLRRATATDARMAILGRARWTEKNGAKLAVVAWANQQGWQVRDHNIADALVLWRYACVGHQPRAKKGK